VGTKNVQIPEKAGTRFAPKTVPPLRCAGCGEPLALSSQDRKTCSERCRKRAIRARQAKRISSVVRGTNATLIAEAAKLHIRPNALVADVTWGQGRFWRKLGDLCTVIGSDIEPRAGAKLAALLDHLPYADSSLDVVVLDPPYLSRPERAMHYQIGDHYKGRSTATGLDHDDIIDRFYVAGMREALRVLKPGGQLWVKCKDELVSRRQRRSHIEIHTIAGELGFSDRDLFVHVSNNAGPNGQQQQKHARKRNSFLWIFEKPRRARLRVVTQAA